ncbi:MAG: ATP-binding protein [Archaeoglobaceae archaeon]
MSSEINYDLCIGCGDCLLVCPQGIIDLNEEGKAVITDPNNCDNCCSCVEICPQGAISNPKCRRVTGGQRQIPPQQTLQQPPQAQKPEKLIVTPMGRGMGRGRGRKMGGQRHMSWPKRPQAQKQNRERLNSLEDKLENLEDRLKEIIENLKKL